MNMNLAGILCLASAFWKTVDCPTHQRYPDFFISSCQKCVNCLSMASDRVEQFASHSGIVLG